MWMVFTQIVALRYFTKRRHTAWLIEQLRHSGGSKYLFGERHALVEASMQGAKIGVIHAFDRTLSNAIERFHRIHHVQYAQGPRINRESVPAVQPALRVYET